MRRQGLLPSLLSPKEGWLSFVFLCGVALCSVWSIQVAAWVDNLDILTWITLLGIVVGYVLAKVPLPAPWLHSLGLSSGSAIVLYAVAGTLEGHSFRQKSTILLDRFDQWLRVTLEGGISTDNLLFLLLLSGVFWLVGYYGAWSVFRARGPWWVILTSGSVLVVNLSYARSLGVFAFFYLLSALMLVLRLNIAVQEEEWERGGVEYSADFGWSLLRSSGAVAVLIVVATWMAPNIAASQHLAGLWTNMSGPWQNLEAGFSRMFGGLRVKEESSSSGFSKALALRGATALGNAPVLAVDADEPRYLRGVVYDRYTGQGWLAPERDTEQMLPNDSRLAVTGNLLMRDTVTSTIRVLEPRGMTVLVPAQPLRISVPVAAEYESSARRADVDQTEDAYVDVSVLRASAMLRQGQQYVAVSSVSRADAKSLRSAGTQYPDWVEERYLAVPRSIPGRVAALARRTAAASANQYDKAMAIQNLLRSYPYSDVVPPPPVGRDAVDYFLFQAGIGYCDYYASAMVVMLRSLGVPARVVSGYAPGERDAAQRAYVVRDSSAHSWPEVYFPRYGWVEFEPTASRPAPTRLEEATPASEDLPDTLVPEPSNTELEDGVPEDDGETFLPAENIPASTGPSAFSSLLLLVPATALAVYLSLSLVWRRLFRGLSPSEVMYGKVSRVAGWAGIRRQRHQTPYEYAVRLAALVPDAARDVEFVVDSFVRKRFGQKSLAPDEEHMLRESWRRMRRRLLRLFWRRLSLWRGR